MNNYNSPIVSINRTNSAFPDINRLNYINGDSQKNIEIFKCNLYGFLLEKGCVVNQWMLFIINSIPDFMYSGLVSDLIDYDYKEYIAQSLYNMMNICGLYIDKYSIDIFMNEEKIRIKRAKNQ